MFINIEVFVCFWSLYQIYYVLKSLSVLKSWSVFEVFIRFRSLYHVLKSWVFKVLISFKALIRFLFFKKSLSVLKSLSDFWVIILSLYLFVKLTLVFKVYQFLKSFPVFEVFFYTFEIFLLVWDLSFPLWGPYPYLKYISIFETLLTVMAPYTYVLQGLHIFSVLNFRFIWIWRLLGDKNPRQLCYFEIFIYWCNQIYLFVSWS